MRGRETSIPSGLSCFRGEAVRRVAVELNFQAHNPSADYQRARIQFARVEFELTRVFPDLHPRNGNNNSVINGY